LHRVTEVEQHFGDAAHAAAADSNEVNGVDAAHPVAPVGAPAPLYAGTFQQSAPLLDHAARLASCRQEAASSSVASGLASRRARSAMARSLSRPAQRRSSSAARRSAVRSRSAMSTAAPSRTRNRAL